MDVVQVCWVCVSLGLSLNNRHFYIDITTGDILIQALYALYSHCILPLLSLFEGPASYKLKLGKMSIILVGRP